MPRRSESSAGTAGSLTSARLLELLSSTVGALEREAQTVAGTRANGSGGDSATEADARRASIRAVTVLLDACMVPAGDVAAAAGAGRVPLPSPAPEVEAALGALARLIGAGCAPAPAGAAGAARRAAAGALRAVQAVVFASPRRAAVVVRHQSLMGALAAALAVRGGDVDAFLLAAAVDAAKPLLLQAAAVSEQAALWRAGASGAGLRALAVAFAGGIAALLRPRGGAAAPSLRVESETCTALAAAIVLCPDAERPGLCDAVLAQPGLAEALCACVARAAAAPPPAGAPCPELVRGSRALIVAAVLCSNGAVEMEYHADLGGMLFSIDLRASQPGGNPMMERLLAAAPALLGRVVDAVATAAPWCHHVAAALGPGGAGGDVAAAVAFEFARAATNLWAWAVSVLEMVPLRALTADAGRSHMARLAPALLDLAQAAHAAAFAPSGPSLELTTPMRFGASVTAIMAARLLDAAGSALGDAAPALLNSVPGAHAALLRLGASPPPLLLAAAGGGGGVGQYASLLNAHCGVQVHALQALSSAARTAAGARRIATVLQVLPPLLATAGGAVGLAEIERRLARGDDTVAALQAVRRRAAVEILARCVAPNPSDPCRVDTRFLRCLVT